MRAAVWPTSIFCPSFKVSAFRQLIPQRMRLLSPGARCVHLTMESPAAMQAEIPTMTAADTEHERTSQPATTSGQEHGHAPQGKAKRKLALHVAYCGTGFAGKLLLHLLFPLASLLPPCMINTLAARPPMHRSKHPVMHAAGLQLQKGAAGITTVEAALEEAIAKTGGILDSNRGALQKIDWSRSSRTDKGVHSCSTVRSLRGPRVLCMPCCSGDLPGTGCDGVVHVPACVHVLLHGGMGHGRPNALCDYRFGAKHVRDGSRLGL